jgi:hypothetical protein
MISLSYMHPLALSSARTPKDIGMPHLVSITFPVALARAYASNANPALGDSPHFQAKAVLAEAFGEGRIRPWRLLVTADGVHMLAGWARSLDDLKPTPQSRRLGVVIDDLDWTAPADGERIALDVLAVPHKQVTRPDGRKIYLDISSRLDAVGGILNMPLSERPPIWAAWFASSLTAPRTGIVVEGTPTIVGSDMITTIRAERRQPLRLQTARALVTARIADRSAFINFLSVGFKKNKDIGMGAVLPAELTLPSLMAVAAE